MKNIKLNELNKIISINSNVFNNIKAKLPNHKPN